MIKKSIPFLLIGLISACGTQKAAYPHRPLLHTAARALLTDIKDSSVTYQTLAATTRISYTKGDSKRSAFARIRMYKDSALWFSLSFIGIPIARALITKDSLLCYEKVNGIYLSEPTKSLSAVLGVALSLPQLEALLSAKPILAEDRTPYKLVHQVDHYLLQYDARTDPRAALKGISSRISVGADKRISEQSLYHEHSGIRVRYSGDLQLAGKRFPKRIQIEVLGAAQALSIEIEYENVEVDKPIRMPFHIPDRYPRSLLP